MRGQSQGTEEPPRFTVPLRDMTINDGEKAILRVCFLGCPSPSITWFFNSKPIQPTQDFKVIMVLVIISYTNKYNMKAQYSLINITE